MKLYKLKEIINDRRFKHERGFTTSLHIADKKEICHKKVIEIIENILFFKTNKDFSFKKTAYIDENDNSKIFFILNHNAKKIIEESLDFQFEKQLFKRR